MSFISDTNSVGGKAWALVHELKKQGRISSVEAEALLFPIGVYIKTADEVEKASKADDQS